MFNSEKNIKGNMFKNVIYILFMMTNNIYGQEK